MYTYVTSYSTAPMHFSWKSFYYKLPQAFLVYNDLDFQNEFPSGH